MIQQNLPTDSPKAEFADFLASRGLTIEAYESLPEHDQNACVAGWLRGRGVDDEMIAGAIMQSHAQRPRCRCGRFYRREDLNAPPFCPLCRVRYSEQVIRSLDQPREAPALPEQGGGLPVVALTPDDRKLLRRAINSLSALPRPGHEDERGTVVTDPATIERIWRSEARLEREDRTSRRFCLFFLLPAGLYAVVAALGQLLGWW